MGQRWKRLGLCAAAAVGVAVATAGLWQAYRYRVAPTDVTPRLFESAGWASGSATLRHEMAAHLAGRGELLGHTRAEVVGRLGPPTAERWPGMLEWDLGERQGGSMLLGNYDEFLLVTLDEREVCRSAEVGVRD
jgi:hypothetical protein